MEKEKILLKKIFVVIELIDKSVPHNSLHSLEAMGLHLAKYFDISLLFVAASASLAEKYSVETKTKTNFSMVLIKVKKSISKTFNEHRISNAYKAGCQIFNSVSGKPNVIIFVGKMNSSFLQNVHRNYFGVHLIAFVNNIDASKNYLKPNIKLKLDCVIYKNETLRNQLENKFLPLTNCVIPLPIDYFESTEISKSLQNSCDFLFVINSNNVLYINDINNKIRNIQKNFPDKIIAISAAANLKSYFEKSIKFGACVFLNSMDEYFMALKNCKEFVLLGEESNSLELLGEFMLNGKNGYSFTDLIHENFPFKSFCKVFEAKDWIGNDDFFVNNNDVNSPVKFDDFNELIDENYSPEVVAFSLKIKIESFFKAE